MDQRFLFFIGIGLLLIAGAAFAGFSLGQGQTTEELEGLTFVSENGSKFCVTVDNAGFLITNPGSCVGN